MILLQVLVRDRIKRLLDPDTELWELATTAGLGLEYGDVSYYMGFRVRIRIFQIVLNGLLKHI